VGGSGGLCPRGGPSLPGRGSRPGKSGLVLEKRFLQSQFFYKKSRPRKIVVPVTERIPESTVTFREKIPVTNGSFQKKIDRPGLQKNRSPPFPSLQLRKKTDRTDRSLRSVGAAYFVPISRPVFRVEVQTVPGDRTDRFYNRSVRPISYSHRTDPLPLTC